MSCCLLQVGLTSGRENDKNCAVKVPAGDEQARGSGGGARADLRENCKDVVSGLLRRVRGGAFPALEIVLTTVQLPN